jgi:hypothetical protein
MSITLSEFAGVNNPAYKMWQGATVAILGNGPSIENFGRKFATGKKIISVNSFFKTILANWVTPDAHVIIDPAYHLDTPLRSEFIASYSTPDTTRTFVTLPSMYHYLTSIEEFQPFGFQTYVFDFEEAFDLCHFDMRYRLPPFNLNVLCAAILFSLFAGAQTVELWGFDHDFLAPKDVSKPNYLPHAYRRDQAADVILYQTPTLEDHLKSVSRLIFYYECLNALAEHANRKILNCSPSSLIPTFERA